MQCMHVLISSYVFLHRNTEAVPCTMKNNENTCCNTAVILTAFCYALEKVFFFSKMCVTKLIYTGRRRREPANT